jgi:hypothetical protein
MDGYHIAPFAIDTDMWNRLSHRREGSTVRIKDDVHFPRSWEWKLVVVPKGYSLLSFRQMDEEDKLRHM